MTELQDAIDRVRSDAQFARDNGASTYTSTDDLFIIIDAHDDRDALTRAFFARHRALPEVAEVGQAAGLYDDA